MWRIVWVIYLREGEPLGTTVQYAYDHDDETVDTLEERLRREDEIVLMAHALDRKYRITIYCDGTYSGSRSN